MGARLRTGPRQPTPVSSEPRNVGGRPIPVLRTESRVRTNQSNANDPASILTTTLVTGRLGILPSLILAGAIDAAVFAGLGLAPDPAVAALMLAGQGFAVTMWNVVTVSLRQQIVPAHLLGRVNSVYRMLGWGLMPVGALTGGFVAHAAGLRAPYIVAGLLCGLSLLAAVPFLRRPPSVTNGTSTQPKLLRPGD